MANAVERYNQRKDIEKYFSGSPLMPVMGGPVAGAQVSGQPAVMPDLSFIQEFLTKDPREGVPEGGWDALKEQEGLPSWWPEGLAGIPREVIKVMTGGGTKEQAQPASAPVSLSFGEPTAQGGSSGGAAAMDIGKYLQGVIPGTQVFSGVRSEERNKRVGGRKDSYHLARRGGLARDLGPPKGVDMKTFHAQVQASLPAGWEAINEGDHVHVEPGKGVAVAQIAPGSTTMPVHFLDAATAASLIPKARTLSRIDLPDAPQRELPGDVPMLEAPDKEALLAELRSVIMPKGRDSTNDAWDRAIALMAGAAEGFAMAGPNARLGNAIGMAGARGARSFSAERKEQTAEQQKIDEAVRQAQVALAKAGLDLDLNALQVRNTNLDRQYSGEERKKDVKFQNANSIFENNVRELTTNLGIDQFNVGTLNSRDMQMAQAAISGLQNEATAQNTANQLAMGGSGGAAAMQDRDINNMLVSIGVDATNDKDPRVLTARSTAAAIRAKDVPSALGSFAQELVIAGGAEQVLRAAAAEKAKTPEQQALQVEVKKALQTLTRAKQSGKAIKPEQLAEVTQMVSTLLNMNQQAALNVVQSAAAAGMPSAKLILAHQKK